MSGLGSLGYHVRGLIVMLMKVYAPLLVLVSPQTIHALYGI